MNSFTESKKDVHPMVILQEEMGHEGEKQTD